MAAARTRLGPPMSICSIEIVEGDARLRRGLHERVEIHHHQIDEADAVLLGELEILGVMTAREDAAVDHRDAAS